MATLFNDYFSTVFTCVDTIMIPTVDSASSPPIVDSIEFTPYSHLLQTNEFAK